MDVLLWLIPVALGLGLIGLIAFLWSLKSGQFDDLDGAAHRILFDDDDENPRKERPRPENRPGHRG
jgi:cytochrome oxidase maturation protein, cbb3-type